MTMKTTIATQSQKWAAKHFFNLHNRHMVQKNLNKPFIFSVKDTLSEETIQMEQIPLLRWQTVWENFSSGKFSPW